MGISAKKVKQKGITWLYFFDALGELLHSFFFIVYHYNTSFLLLLNLDVKDFRSDPRKKSKTCKELKTLPIPIHIFLLKGAAAL